MSSNRSSNGTSPESFRISEIAKIEYQQQLIVERMRKVEYQRKQLEKCLHALQALDSDDDDDDRSA